MPDRVISVPQATQIAQRIKNKFDNVNGRLVEHDKYVTGKENFLVNLSWTTGASIDQSGNYLTSENFRYSDLLELPTGKYMFYGLPKGVNTNTRIHGYDANGDWVRQLKYSSSGAVYTLNYFTFFVTPDVKYIRISTAIGARYTPLYLGRAESVQTMIDDINANVGEWYYSKTIPGAAYPYIQIQSSGSAVNLYVKIIKPENHSSITINGSNDNWSSQTQLYIGNKAEFTAEIPAGYYSLRVILNTGTAYTGEYSAIIHTVDDYSLSQAILDGQNNIKSIEDELTNVGYVPSENMNGTKYDGFYLNSAPYQGIQSISNTNFYIVSHPVEKGKAYYLIGKSVAINASLPIACYGTASVADDNSYIEKILDGSATAQDYMKRYIAPDNGYIYIAGYSTNNQLLCYNSEPISDAYIKDETIHEKTVLTIQLFGDSITDNTWGDSATWANYIPDYMPNAEVTVENNAIGGSKLTHSNTNNGVWDLVCSENNSVLDANADVIVILSGTNDWAGVTAGTGDNIGAWGGNNYTIYGALQQIIEKISEDTHAKLIICTPPQRYNSVDAERPTDSKGTPLNYNGKTLREFCDAMIEVSEYYGIMCLDLNSILGWNRKNVSKFTSDGLHPNGAGDKWVGRLICNEIKRHMMAEYN